ncbi:MAG: DUF4177 domain-containing protein [Desulfocapsaceae bacterium]|jgi:hypothetical protein|nr:DUF4177 domain-containing protein [Desulfocapsaceae bacterium]
MRWGYKTVQFGLKKEGLLGSSFLDEAEVEQSLNEFGLAGWELVSLFGMQDGLMAVFKQPLEMKVASVPKSVTEDAAALHRFTLGRREEIDADSIIERKIGRGEPVVSVSVEKEDKEEGVGGIRIE